MYEKVLVPTDGSDEATGAAEYAIELASTFDATIHALYAIEPEYTTLPSEAMRHEEVYEDHREWGERVTADVTARAAERGLDGVATVTDGTPQEAILEYAADEDVDLVVMGTAGRAGWREQLVGSVTERVVRTADVPVLTVRGENP